MTYTKRILLYSLLSVILLFSFGCPPRIPPDALKLTEKSIEHRQLQTRIYDTKDEAKILASCAGLMQDMGFNLDESETELGVLVGSKQRSAKKASQVAASIFLAVLTGEAVPVDDKQKMRLSIVTKPAGEEQERISVRVTFQRIVWNTQGQICKKEFLDDPEIYQEFYSKLSKSLFLEAHKI